MKLFTKQIEKKLQDQYKFGAELEKQNVIAKIFNPYGQGTWYIMNQDPDDSNYLWAIVNLFEVEMGSVSKSELINIKVPPFNLPLERDLSFKEQGAKNVWDNLLDGKHV